MNKGFNDWINTAENRCEDLQSVYIMNSIAITSLIR